MEKVLIEKVKYQRKKKYPIAFDEKKVMVFGPVKRKYHRQAQAEIKALIEKWR